ncbi:MULTISPECIES: hypothetical protein [Cryobacterium]|uniref:hypothetical protein n=1 Tax=Cryobacterium TaxID=69578 RepID=UPI0013FD180D|nr:MULTISPECIES: hypothetical protein [Cryobacterium]MEC5184164.1 hypothetical protein [Cryobacterium sp. MP_3.1]
MYAAIWRLMPGPVWVRILLVLVLLAAVLYSLATWVFPWVDTMVNNQEVTVGVP